MLLGLNNARGAMHVYCSKLMEKSGARGGLAGKPNTVLVSETIPTREPGRNQIPRRRSQGVSITAPPHGSTTGGAVTLLLPRGQRAVLVAIAQHGSCELGQLRTLTGYRSSTLYQTLKELCAAKLASRDGKQYVATDAGIARLGTDYERLPTGAKLLAHWLAKLGAGQSKVLSLLSDHYPSGLTAYQVEYGTGYKTSTTYQLLKELRAMKLCESREKLFILSDMLVDDPYAT